MKVNKINDVIKNITKHHSGELLIKYNICLICVFNTLN